MKKAMVLLAYNRFDYFKTVVESIINQTVDGVPAINIYDLYISQDGCRSDDLPENIAQHQLISHYLTQLAERFKTIKVIRHPKNLGIGMHFDYVERMAFEENKYDFVVFFEDDLQLAPGYMQMMTLMAKKFKDDPRIGMFSAFNPTPRTLEEQKEQASKYGLMGHNWGFGLFRSFWLRRQPVIDAYLDFIRDIPYKKMPRKLICDWLIKLGFAPSGTGQDHIKACATNALGCLRIAPIMNFGIPIGKVGANFNEDLFNKLNFDQIVTFDEIPLMAPDLCEEDFRQLFKSQAGWYCSPSIAAAIDEPDRQNFDDFEKKARQGLLHPSVLLPDEFNTYLAQKNILKHFGLYQISEWSDELRFDKNLSTVIESKRAILEERIANEYEAETIFFLVLGRQGGKERSGKNVYSIFTELLNSKEYNIKYNQFHHITPSWQPDDIPDTPSMDKEGLQLFQQRLASSICFLEFGAGGSTVLAAKSGVETVYSVESDLSWALATRLKAEQLGSNTNITIHYVNIGPTKEWGWPSNEDYKYKWPDYSQSIFTLLFRACARPDLILINGRFRIACFLTSLAYSSRGARILFDDYYDRPHYHVVERFLKPAARAGRMAEFVVDSTANFDGIFFEINKYICDPS